MKHILLILAVMLSAWSFQAGAATVDLGLVDDNADIGNDGLSGSFSDTYTFTVPGNNIGGSFSVTNSFVVRTNAGFIENFVATLDGVAFTPVTVPGTQLLSLDLAAALASGVHELVVTGVGVAVNGRTASYGGSIQIDTSEVPVPAAVWLFGSALAGLFGTKRRRQAYA